MGGGSQSGRSAAVGAAGRMAEQPLELGAMALHGHQPLEFRRIHDLRVAFSHARRSEVLDDLLTVHHRRSWRSALQIHRLLANTYYIFASIFYLMYQLIS